MRLALLAALTTGFAFADTAGAAIISGGAGNGSAPLNNTAPANDPGFNRVGTVGTNGTGVYLGDGWVLTASHVNGKNIFVVDGVEHHIIPGTGHNLLNPDNSPTDLYLFKVALPGDSPLQGMDLLEIAMSGPTINNVGVFIGTGLTQAQQQALTWYVVNTPDGLQWHTTDPGGQRSIVTGFQWSDQREKRWAEMRISELNHVHDISGATVYGFATRFDMSNGFGNAAVYDSGSPLFLPDGQNGWVLAGIAHAVLGFENQPAQTTMHGNLTFWSDLSIYRDQILAVIPEPTTLLLLTGAVPLLFRRRN